MQILRWTQTPRWVRGLATMLAIAISAGMLLAGGALGAPRMTDAKECEFAADMSATAAALAVEGVEREKAERAMAHIYLLTEHRGRPLMLAIVAVAYRDKPPPIEFVAAMFKQCMTSGGNLDPILGTDS